MPDLRPADVPRGKKRAFRTWYPALIAAVVGFLFPVAVISSVFRGSSSLLGQWLPSALAILFGGFLLVRVARSGVYTLGSGVKVLNPFKSVEIPWLAIRRFSLGRCAFSFPLIGRLELEDGTIVCIWGIQGPNPFVWISRRSADDVVNLLNDELKRRKG